MLFHLGALWRLHELGYLVTLQRISSVSGGSITSAQLALTWQVVSADASGTTFRVNVVEPIRRLAGTAAVSPLAPDGSTAAS